MLKHLIYFSLFFTITSTYLQAQIARDTTQTYVIIKNDGAEYVGKIIAEDARELLLRTDHLGNMYIPKHEIKEIVLQTMGNDARGEQFSTRYYFSTNGFSLSDENYVIWNLFGPDIQINYKDKMGIGLITTWFGSPIIGSIKFSKSLDEQTHLGYGSLLGTGSWSQLSVGGILPYISLTKGNTSNNLTISAGYGVIWDGLDTYGNALLSIAGMKKTNDRVSLILDSFTVYNSSEAEIASLIIPGVRLETQRKRAVQIGFAATIQEGELYPFPLPLIQWFRTF